MKLAYVAYNVAVDTNNSIFLFCMVYNFFGVKRKPCLLLRVMVSLTLISYPDNKILQQGRNVCHLTSVNHVKLLIATFTTTN